MPKELLDEEPSLDLSLDNNEGNEIEREVDITDDENEYTEAFEGDNVVIQEALQPRGTIRDAKLGDYGNENKADLARILNDAAIDGNIGEVLLPILDKVQQQAARNAVQAFQTQQSLSGWEEYADDAMELVQNGVSDTKAAVMAALYNRAMQDGIDPMDYMAHELTKRGYGNIQPNASTTQQKGKTPIPPAQRVPSGRSTTAPSSVYQGRLGQTQETLRALYGNDTFEEYVKR